MAIANELIAREATAVPHSIRDEAATATSAQELSA
jgi:hypothetical protein